jgi:hypothetical protein
VELLKTLYVGLEAFLRQVLAARVDRDADGTSELARNTGSLELNERETASCGNNQLCNPDPGATRCVPSRTRRLSTSSVSVALLPRYQSTYT